MRSMRGVLVVAVSVVMMGSAAATASARAPVIAYLNASNQLALYDSQTGAPASVPAITVKQPVQNAVAVSFDGRYIAYVAQSDGDIHLYDRDAGAEVALPGINLSGYSPSNLSVSDTGLIAFDNAGNGPAVVYSSASKAFISTGLPSGHRQPVLSGDGNFLATTCITGGTDCVNNTINSGHSTLFLQNLTTQKDTGLPVLNGNKDEEHPCVDEHGDLVGADVADTPHRDVYVFDRSTNADLSLGFVNTPSTADTIRCALSFAGGYVDVQTDNGAVRLYDSGTGSQISVPSTVTGPPALLTAPFLPPNAPTITTPANGAQLGQGQLVHSSYACSDFAGGIGIASCAGPVANGSAIDTSSPGKHSFTVVATEVNGLSASVTSTYTVLPRPTVSKLRQSHRRWREHKSPTKSPPVGTTFSFRLNEPANVVFAFTQPARGHKRKGKCVVHKKSGHPCKLAVTKGTLTFQGKTGLNKLHFRGRIPDSHALRPGTYKLKITATDAAGQSSSQRSLTFTIVK